MNYCDLNEYEDYIENIEFFLKEKPISETISNLKMFTNLYYKFGVKK